MAGANPTTGAAGPVVLTKPAQKRYAAPISAFDTVEIGPEDTVVASKDIVADDEYLSGHYPDFTIYPGVFTIETVHQAARAALEADGSHATLAGIVSVHFKAPLLPGDRLTAELRLQPSADDPDLVRVKARCHRADGESSARITLDMRVRKAAPA